MVIEVFPYNLEFLRGVKAGSIVRRYLARVELDTVVERPVRGEGIRFLGEESLKHIVVVRKEEAKDFLPRGGGFPLEVLRYIFIRDAA